VDIALIVWEQEDVIFKLRDANVPQVKMFAQVLQNFGLDSYLRFLQSNNLLQKSLAKLRFNLWCQRACQFNKVLEDLVECFSQVLLITSFNEVPELPEHLAEDLFCDVVTKGVFRINPNNFRQWLHQIVKLLILILFKLPREPFQ
jgi:hypothetical protein